MEENKFDKISEKGWTAMATLLDQHLPVQKKNKRTGFLILLAGAGFIIWLVLTMFLVAYFMKSKEITLQEQAFASEENSNNHITGSKQNDSSVLISTPIRSDSSMPSIHLHPIPFEKKESLPSIALSTILDKETSGDYIPLNTGTINKISHSPKVPFTSNTPPNTFREHVKITNSLPVGDEQNLKTDIAEHVENNIPVDTMDIAQDPGRFDSAHIGLTVNAQIPQMVGFQTPVTDTNYRVEPIDFTTVKKEKGRLGLSAQGIIEYEFDSKNIGYGGGFELYYRLDQKWKVSIAPLLVFQNKDTQLKNKAFFSNESEDLFNPTTTSPVNITNLEKTNILHLDIYPKVSYTLMPGLAIFSGIGFSYLQYTFKTNRNYFDTNANKFIAEKSVIGSYSHPSMGMCLGTDFQLLPAWSVHVQANYPLFYLRSKGNSVKPFRSSIGLSYNFN